MFHVNCCRENYATVVVDDSFAPSYTVTYPQSGNYTLTCQYTDADGLTGTAHQDVVVYAGEGKTRFKLAKMFESII